MKQEPFMPIADVNDDTIVETSPGVRVLLGDLQRTPPPMTDDLVGRLRERMAAASEQPWVYRPNKHDDWGWIRGTERDSDIGRYRPIVANAKNSDIDDMQSYRDAGTDPYGPNALLIVEAVNALPTLLARIEALEAENRKIREAIKPFADCADELDGSEWTPRAPDGEWAKFRLLTDDYRAARAALTPEAPHAD